MIETIVAAIIGSNALFGFIQWGISRYLDAKSVTRQTLAAVAYTSLSDKIEARLDAGYATPEQRRELDILFDAYKANKWNGDMDSRMEKVYNLPTKDLRKANK